MKSAHLLIPPCWPAPAKLAAIAPDRCHAASPQAIQSAFDIPAGISDRISARSPVGGNRHFPYFGEVSNIGKSPHNIRLPIHFAGSPSTNRK